MRMLYITITSYLSGTVYLLSNTIACRDQSHYLAHEREYWFKGTALAFRGASSLHNLHQHTPCNWTARVLCDITHSTPLHPPTDWLHTHTQLQRCQLAVKNVLCERPTALDLKEARNISHYDGIMFHIYRRGQAKSLQTNANCTQYRDKCATLGTLNTTRHTITPPLTEFVKRSRNLDYEALHGAMPAHAWLGWSIGRRDTRHTGKGMFYECSSYSRPWARWVNKSSIVTLVIFTLIMKTWLLRRI